MAEEKRIRRDRRLREAAFILCTGMREVNIPEGVTEAEAVVMAARTREPSLRAQRPA